MSTAYRLFLPLAAAGEGDSSSSLIGKGVWARPRADGTSELDRAVAIAQQIGATHILYKVAQGATYLGGSAQAAQRIVDAGLVPFAWVWLLLDDPTEEARAAERAFQDGYQGLIFDTEAPCSNRFARARTLAREIQRAGLDPNALYNCSFPNILHHRDLPYDELNEVCRGGLMPMAYGSFFAPGDPTPWQAQARQVIDDWTYGHYASWNPVSGVRPPLYPVLAPYHDEHGAVRMSPAELQVWIDRLAVHAPTFISLFTAAVIDDALLPLLRDFLQSGEPVEEEPVPATVWPAALHGTPLYDSPLPGAQRLRAVIYGTAMTGVALSVTSAGRWLRVRLPDGELFWVPEENVTTVLPGPLPVLPAPPPPPAGQLTHVWTRQEVNYRSQPVVRPESLIGRLYAGAQLRILEDPVQARSKLGVHGQWFNVHLEPDGPQGWMAAWYVVDRAPTEEPVTVTHVSVESEIGLNVRAAPSTSARAVWHVPEGTVLELLGDLEQARAKIGVPNEWVRVRSPSLHEGFVAAWHLSLDVPPDNRTPVQDAVLPFGTCAWTFGIHGVGSTDTRDFRPLYHGSGRKGWVLFTESIGRQPGALQANEDIRRRLWDWAQDGHGVILRLNHGYEPAGTLPESAHYQGFADTCARYAELYLRHAEVEPNLYAWVVVIGNEQNNVREHPGGADDPREHITPLRYARAFNLAYHAIKRVLPNAIVVPGAVDPYNTYPWRLHAGQRYRPLDYFREMLAGIEELDGFALHCNTHGPVVDYITHKKVFQDAPLDPGTANEHYYDFLAYRSFVEAIPARWRNRPVYITETNHWVVNRDGSPPVGWVNSNVGWVRAAYQEIHRWNSTPHSQQIHCLLLYRWQGDQWELESKDRVLEDFKQALQNDHRWRR